MWKILHLRTSNHLGIDFHPTNEIKGIKAILKPLPKVGSRLQNMYENSFVVIGPKIWNKLPPMITTEHSFSSFKSALDKFLLSVPDTPPIQGYPFMNKNSLVEILHVSR